MSTTVATGADRSGPVVDRQMSAPTDPELWVDQYGDLLLSYALAHNPQREAAEDLVQETFMAAWRGRDQFKGQAKFETWLVSILRNKIRDRLRRSKRDAASLDEAIHQAADNQVDSGDETSGSLFDSDGNWLRRPVRWSAVPEGAAETSEFWAVVQQCLAGLPSHLASAFRLKLMTPDTNQQISEALDVTPANLSVRLHRARLLLRSCLQQKWFDEGRE